MGGVSVLAHVFCIIIGTPSDMILTVLGASKYSYAFMTGYLLAFMDEKLEKWNLIAWILLLAYSYIASGFRIFAYLLSCSIIIRTILNGYLKFLNNKIFVYLGNISYELYLIHDYIGYEIIRKVSYLGWKNEYNIIVPISLSIFLATIIHIFGTMWSRSLKEVIKSAGKFSKN